MTKEKKPSPPWIAFALGVLCPSLGHFYAGATWRLIPPLLLSLLLLGFPPSGVVSLIGANHSIPALPALGLILSFRFLVFPLEAALLVWRRDLPRRSWNRWEAYVTYAILVSVGSLALMPVKLLISPYRSYTIPTGSMIPTMLIGDTVAADMRTVNLQSLRVGDLVVYEIEDGYRLIKRVAGLPNQTIAFEPDLVIDGVPCTYLSYGLEADEICAGVSYTIRLSGDTYEPKVVPPDHVFILGDNRHSSLDSRVQGPIPLSAIKGRVTRVLWSKEPDYSRSSNRWNLFDHLVRIRWSRFGEDLRAVPAAE